MTEKQKQELEEFKESDWYLDRPKVIREAINKYPPNLVYILNNKECCIYSYEEPKSQLLEEVTVTITTSDLLGIITYNVFGVNPADLKIKDEEEMG